MQIAIGLLIIVGGILFSVYWVKQAERRAASAPKTEPVRPVPIEDAVAALKKRLAADPDARLHVELYGLARTDRPAAAPITERPAACWRSVSYSCRPKGGERPKGLSRYREALEQSEAYRESGPRDFYIMDSTSDDKIYVDLDSFGEKAELIKACDSYEEAGSKWMERHLQSCRRFFPRTGPSVEGYHVVEFLYHVDQPLNVVGDLYRRGGEYHAAASAGGERSLVTYRSEEQAARVLQKSRLSAGGFALVAAAIGLGVMIAGFR